MHISKSGTLRGSPQVSLIGPGKARPRSDKTLRGLPAVVVPPYQDGVQERTSTRLAPGRTQADPRRDPHREGLARTQ